MVDLSKDPRIQAAGLRMQDLERARRIAVNDLDDAIAAGNKDLASDLVSHIASIRAEKINIQAAANEYGSEIVRQERASQPRSMEKLDKLELHEMTPDERYQYFNNTMPKEQDGKPKFGGLDPRSYEAAERRVQSPEYRRDVEEAERGGKK